MRILSTLSLLALLATVSPAAEIVGPTRSGLPGLGETLAAPDERSASLRLSLYYLQGSLDPGHGFSFSDAEYGAATRSQELRLSLALHASRYVLISGSLPLRAWSSDGYLVSDTSGTHREGDGDERGLGDAEAAIAARIADLGAVRLGGFGSVRLPSGEKDLGFSSGEIEGELGLLASAKLSSGGFLPETIWHSNVGWRLNKNEADGAGQLVVGTTPNETGIWPVVYPARGDGAGETENDMLLLRTGVEFRRRWGHIFLELSSDWLARNEDISFGESPHWFTPGIYIGRDDGPALKVAWSIGLHADDGGTDYTPAYPDWAFGAGISMPFHLGGRDRDFDEIADKEDACPELAEDFDGYADEDGCPDEDNDGDGILDRRDRAPNLAEDFDGFEDTDGRPDRDNDLDGIADEVDKCPLQAEDFDSFEDEDGCPDLFVDSDLDGIEDALDRCPQSPEDLDNFEDADGCPELDNDLDGIEDTKDACPNEKEDYDGDRDGDGCADS